MTRFFHRFHSSPSVALLVLLGLATSAPAHQDGKVNLQRIDAAVHVQASAVLDANLDTVWATLVGYERLPEFIPDMTDSKVLERDGRRALVRQGGRAGLGPFMRNFTLTLNVEEDPLREVSSVAVSGDFTRFESSYRLLPLEDGRTRLDYTSLLEPRDGIPPLVGEAVMHRSIQRQFNALLAEIERVASLRFGVAPEAQRQNVNIRPARKSLAASEN